MYNCIRAFGVLLIIGSAISSAASKYSDEDCEKVGFSTKNLFCSTCEKSKNFNLNEKIYENCRECCIADDTASVTKYPLAVLEVCTCKFSSYPQIQAFIKSDRRWKYKNLDIKYVRGLDPIIKLYDANKKLGSKWLIDKWDTDTVDKFLDTHLIVD